VADEEAAENEEPVDGEVAEGDAVASVDDAGSYDDAVVDGDETGEDQAQGVEAVAARIEALLQNRQDVSPEKHDAGGAMVQPGINSSLT
jgi:hypothetical protein